MKRSSVSHIAVIVGLSARVLERKLCGKAEAGLRHRLLSAASPLTYRQLQRNLNRQRSLQ
jgi:hypothetical protein